MNQATQFSAFVYPGDLTVRTGGYIYDARIIEEMEKAGRRIHLLSLASTFPFPTDAEMDHSLDQLMQLPAGLPAIIDGLAFGVFGERASCLAQDRSIVALVHHPLAYETGLSAKTAAKLADLERRSLGFAHHIVVTSPTTAQMLVKDFAVDAANITIAEPGFDPKPRAAPPDGPVRLLAVGTVTARKDFASLIQALQQLKHHNWQLTIAGSLTRDPDCANALQRQLDRSSIQPSVDLIGEVDSQTLERLYRQSHVFVSTSKLEGYGMAMMDAIGFGLPVVALKGGAVEDVLPKDASILLEADDQPGLVRALAQIIDDRELRALLSERAWAAAGGLPRWAESAARIASAIEALRVR